MVMLGPNREYLKDQDYLSIEEQARSHSIEYGLNLAQFTQATLDIIRQTPRQ